MFWHRTINTAAAVDPVTAAEAKLHMRVTTAADDTLIADLITAATRYCEEFTGRAFITQTWDIFSEEDFPSEIVLPFPPLQSAGLTIKYDDAAGAQQTLAAATYQVDTDSTPWRIKLNVGYTWPATYGNDYGNIEIQFKAGYGDATTNVPDGIREAIYLLTAHWYEHREAATDGRPITEIPLTIKALLWQYRVTGVD